MLIFDKVFKSEPLAAIMGFHESEVLGEYVVAKTLGQDYVSQLRQFIAMRLFGVKWRCTIDQILFMRPENLCRSRGEFQTVKDSDSTGGNQELSARSVEESSRSVVQLRSFLNCVAHTFSHIQRLFHRYC